MTEIWILGLYGLGVMLGIGLATWLYSLYKNDVSGVDSLWPLMFLAGAPICAFLASSINERNLLLLALIVLSTNAFIPGKPRNKSALIEGGQLL